MKPEPPVSIRLEEPVLTEYRSIANRTDIAVGTLLRWAAVNYLRDIRAGRVVLMPFTDESHLNATDIAAQETKAKPKKPRSEN